MSEAPAAPAAPTAEGAPATPATQANLEERYGRGRQRGIDRRLGWGLAGAAVALGLVLLLFSGWQGATSIEYRDLHYEVIDARTVRVDFEVTAPSGAPVACALEALSTSFATVGWRVIELPVSEQRTRRFSETLITTYEGTTGTLRNCWIVEN